MLKEFERSIGVTCIEDIILLSFIAIATVYVGFWTITPHLAVISSYRNKQSQLEVMFCSVLIIVRAASTAPSNLNLV